MVGGEGEVVVTTRIGRDGVGVHASMRIRANKVPSTLMESFMIAVTNCCYNYRLWQIT